MNLTERSSECAETEQISISVVVPCFNSSQSVAELVKRLTVLFEGTVRESFEIILVDDGSSRSETWLTLARLANECKQVRALKLTRNFGKPGALLCGYRTSRGSHVIGMDDDLQHVPEDIPLLLKQREHGLVMGQFEDRRHALWQRIASRIKNWLDYKMIGKPRDVYISPFHMIRRDIVDAMISIQSPTPNIGALMMHVTRDVAMVHVSHEQRKYGKSNFTLKRRLNQFSNLLINNSSLLLKLVAGLGLVISILSLLFGAYLTIRRLFVDQIVEGWTSLMVVTLIVGGVVMFSLGVVGEYLLRIINGLEKRPAFIVGDRIGFDTSCKNLDEMK